MDLNPSSGPKTRPSKKLAIASTHLYKTEGRKSSTIFLRYNEGKSKFTAHLLVQNIIACTNNDVQKVKGHAVQIQFFLSSLWSVLDQVLDPVPDPDLDSNEIAGSYRPDPWHCEYTGLEK
jgi:hypothetical protein